MKRHLFFQLSVFAVLTIIAIIAIWTLIVPHYQAMGEVRVPPVIPYLVFQTENTGLIPQYDSYVNTQVSIIRSQTVLLRVLDQREIQDTQWYKTPYTSFSQRFGKNQPSTMERLRDALSVSPRKGTEIIDVSFAAINPNDAKVIVNAVLEQYMKYISEISNTTENQLYQQLVDHDRQLQNDIIAREKVISDMQMSLGLPGMNSQELLSRKVLRIDETQANLSRVEQEIAVLEWKIKNSINVDSNKSAADTNDMMKQQLEQVKLTGNLLLEDLKKQRTEYEKLFKGVQLMDKENLELSHKRDLFDAVRQRRDQMDMERNVRKPIEILAPASASSKPYHDRRILITIIAIVLWFGISGIAILLRTRINKIDKNKVLS